jgi:hypothetical protein
MSLRLRMPPSIIFGVLGLLVGLAAPSTAHAEDPTDLGAPILPGAKSVGAHRYEIRGEMGGVLDFYGRRFKGLPNIRKSTLLNTAQVKSVHYCNDRERDEWACVNVYRIQGVVRVYVLPRADLKKAQQAMGGAQPQAVATDAAPVEE